VQTPSVFRWFPLVRSLPSTISAYPWPRPAWLKNRCSMASQVLRACPTARLRSYWDRGLRPSPAGLAAGHPLATAELSRFPYMVLTHMPQVSGSGELIPALALSHRLHVAFPLVLQGRRSRRVISEINTAPVHPSANASPRHHWSSTHSLRSKRVANPYSVKDFHLLHHAGFDRRFPNVPSSFSPHMQSMAD
jgi:hypothetical protein